MQMASDLSGRCQVVLERVRGKSGWAPLLERGPLEASQLAGPANSMEHILPSRSLPRPIMEPPEPKNYAMTCSTLSSFPG